MNNIHFKSERLDWKTPKAVYQILNAEFTFDHDPCPPKPKTDGLKSEWGGVLICEPSLRKGIAKMDKKRIRRMAERKNSCFSYPKSDRYNLVARLLYEVYRNKIYKGAFEI